MKHFVSLLFIESFHRISHNFDWFAGLEQAESGVADADFGDDSVDHVAIGVELGQQRFKIRAAEAIQFLLFENDLLRDRSGA